MSMSTRKPHDKSSKSKDIKKETSQQKAVKTKKASVTSALVINEEVSSLSARVSKLVKDHTQDFSPEYSKQQQTQVHLLDEQINIKLKNKLSAAPAYIEKMLNERDSLTPDDKSQFRTRFLEPIESSITELTPSQFIATLKEKNITPAKIIAARVSEYSLKLEQLLKLQQEAVKLQVEIAALPASAPNRELIEGNHSINIETIGKSVLVMQDLLARSTRLLQLISNLNKCLAKPEPVADKKSAYAAPSPTQFAPKTEVPKAEVQHGKKEGITTGPQGGKK